MNIIVCLDDKNGMLFNKRRQSSDIVLTNRVLALCDGSRLWMNEYSARLFDGKAIFTDNDFLKKAEKGDYCFIENVDISEFAEKVEKVIIYRWNRVYPSDIKFPSELFSDKWRLLSRAEFAGNSHPVITEEVYGL